MNDDALQIARDGFPEAQKRAGSADIVARVRRMPNGATDVAWMRREAMRQRSRLGSLAGTQPHLARIAVELGRPAPKAHFFAVVVTLADDSDASVVLVTKQAPTVA